MSNRVPNIVIDKLSLDRFDDLYDALRESNKEWFAMGMMPKADLSRDEFEQMLKTFITAWEQGSGYVFHVVDGQTHQIVGMAFLSQINHIQQIGNLGYLVRTSRTGEGIGTEAARWVAKYGFEKLGLQRIEIVIHPDNVASLKVAEKVGAKREALLRNRIMLHGVSCGAYMHSLIPEDLGLSRTA